MHTKQARFVFIFHVISLQNTCFQNRTSRLEYNAKVCAEVATSGQCHRRCRAGQSQYLGCAEVWFSSNVPRYIWYIFYRHLEGIKQHWTGQSDLVTFHTPALAALDKRCGKHFATGVYHMVKAFDPMVDLSTWSPSDRSKLAARHYHPS
jgi:hypothetical protein